MPALGTSLNWRSSHVVDRTSRPHPYREGVEAGRWTGPWLGVPGLIISSVRRAWMRRDGLVRPSSSPFVANRSKLAVVAMLVLLAIGAVSRYDRSGSENRTQPGSPRMTPSTTGSERHTCSGGDVPRPELVAETLTRHRVQHDSAASLPDWGQAKTVALLRRFLRAGMYEYGVRRTLSI